jgi:formate dehydrogenase major subunit
LGSSFGRGGATTYQQSLAESDCIVIQGSNMAECHPVGYQWVTEARLRGAKVIHVDPRFTRTSATSDKHVPIRAGSDIAFLGALINHVLTNDLWFEEYVRSYTNASTIVNDDFRDTEDLNGVFSGYDPETGSYDLRSWAYATAQDSGDSSGKIGEGGQDESGKSHAEQTAGQISGAAGAALEHSDVLRDDTLQDPRCVFQILKRHYARYTPEMVRDVCGISTDDFAYVANAITSNSGRERTTAFVYAVGWTQHSVGVQYIRTAAILQLLLGNIGRPGGGIMALRGHASIQGCTDIPTLFDLLPGYLPMPVSGKHESFEEWAGAIPTGQKKGYWAASDAYGVNLLKAWWGDAATADNGWCFDYLPKLTGSHNTYATTMDMLDGNVEGYFLLGQNPAVGSAHGRMQRKAMAELKWLVVRDLNLIESATFWKDGPEIATGELETERIGTEVFFLPAASHAEKDGTFTNTQRMLQFHHQSVRPPGDARSELWFYHELGKRIRARLADSEDPRDRPILDLTWDYPEDEHGEPDAEAVLQEINGRYLTGERAGEMLPSFTEMRADGSTMGGCWIYTGVYADGINAANRRKPGSEQDSVALEWGWAWPMNRRILYNRASADPDGKPWSERKAYVWWDEEQGKWTGHDVPDFPATKAPSFRPEPGATGAEGLAGDDPFIMQSDGKGWLFAPRGVIDGPLPTHYEAQESPVKNALYDQQRNPARKVFPRKDNITAPSAGDPGAGVYPYIFTTYRLTEHHTAGGMSRWLPYLSELQPEFFCEVSPQLAAEQGLINGGWATIVSPRAAIEARVLVTERMKPLVVGGHTVHQVGLPYHWGRGGINAVVQGDSANDLIGITLDPNVAIQESKAASCDIQPGRRPEGSALLRLIEEYQSRAGATAETGNTLLDPGVGEEGVRT